MPKYALAFILKFYFPLLLFCEVDFAVLSPEGDLKDKAIQTLVGLNLILVIAFFNKLSKLLQFIAIATLGLFTFLAIKSYNEYGSFFIYPQVFKKALLPMGICGAYILFSQSKHYTFRYLINWIYIFIAAKIIISFALGGASLAWGSDNRVLSATDAFLLIIPLSHHFISYCQRNEKPYKTMFDLAIIFLAQHRTVWVSATLVMLIIAMKFPFIIKRLFPIVFAVSAIGFLFLSERVLSSSFLKTLSVQFEDILKYKEQGTGSWRYEQSQIFARRIPERPLLGWNFEAYELGEVMEGDWEQAKGTHIHSAYIDPMYYFGIVGLLLLWAAFYFLAIRIFKTPGNDVLFSVFAISAFVYGISYQLPLYAYFFCGLGLYYLEYLKSNSSSALSYHGRG